MVRDLPKAAGGILSYFTRHKTAANLLLVILIVAGLVSMPRMRSQFFPDVIVDNIAVDVRWQGAGAEDVDDGIVQILEPALLSIEGVTEASSLSREGRASISLEFEPGWDMARGSGDVETVLDQINTLPEEADDPKVRRGSWRDRVTDLIISGPLEIDQLALFADELVLRLFAEGVTRTTIRGIAAPQTMIEVPSINLIAFDVTMAQIAAAVAGEVNADPAGDVAGANARVRTGVEKRTAADIGNVVLSGGGHADGWRKAGAYGGPRRSLVRELRRGARSGVRCADACALAQHCGRRLQQRQGRGTGGTGERSWDRRRVRVPETTLSPRLRASARLLFPGRRPIATRASARGARCWQPE